MNAKFKKGDLVLVRDDGSDSEEKYYYVGKVGTVLGIVFLGEYRYQTDIASMPGKCFLPSEIVLSLIRDGDLKLDDKENKLDWEIFGEIVK